MIKHYSVAHHVFTINVPDKFEGRLSQYEPFEVESGDGAVFSLEVVRDFNYEQGEVLYDQPTEPGETKICLFKSQGGMIVKMAPTSQIPYTAECFISSDYKISKLHILRDPLFSLNNSLMLQYAFATSSLDTLEMHASVVKNDGKGYLFLAKSGTGKSTHSQLWLKNVKGSTLLNDDNPIVRAFPDGSVWVFGSPWSGKTPCYVNDSCPVGAFVRIRRSKENTLTALSAFEAYALLYSSSSGFKSDPVMGDGLHSALEKAVCNSKSFVLDCRPDDEAAIVCSEGVR